MHPRRGDDTFAACIRHQWKEFLLHRPDLTPALAPFHLRWFGGASPTGEQLAAAKEVAIAALDNDLFGVMATARDHVDLLGQILTEMRPESAKRDRGQMYTPPDVTNLMAGFIPIDDHARMHDPAVGTGGLFRAAANVMRDGGRNPETVLWTGVDIDQLAIACCAVNAVLWRLGPTVVLAVGDSLSDPECLDRAWGMRQECLDIARYGSAVAETLAFFRQ